MAKANTQSKESGTVSIPKSGNAIFPASPDFNDSIEKLFISSLKDMYWSENHLVMSLPKMIEAASSAKLKNSLTAHLEETKVHSQRLEKVLELLGEEIIAEKCLACEGLVLSGEQKIESTQPDSEVRDAGIIASSLKVENFEIVSYQGLIRTARNLGKENVISLLEKNLNDEIAASKKLESLS